MRIFLIPRLSTSKWRKQLLKVAVVELYISPQHPFWEAEMHEPLLIALCFPILPYDARFAPWQLKNTELVDRTRGYLRQVQKTSEPVEWEFAETTCQGEANFEHVAKNGMGNAT